MREAQVMGGLKHPRIPQVHESGEIEGYLYLTMDYAEGKSLADILGARRRTPLHPAEAFPIIEKVAETLDAAHAQGVIHGGLGPHDILLTADGDVRVSGFGQVELRPGVAADRMPRAARYMAPEQFEPEGEIDQSVDLYALGIILYEMLTGQPPFDSNLMTTLMYSVLRGKPRVPSFVNPQIPENVEEVVLKAMARDRSERYPSGQVLVDALRAAVSEAGPEALQKVAVSPGPRSSTSAPPTPEPRSTSMAAIGSPASTELPRYLPRRYRQRVRRRDEDPYRILIWAAGFAVLAIVLAFVASGYPMPAWLVQPTPTATPSATVTPSVTATATPTATDTATFTITPTETSVPTDTPVPTATDTPTLTPTATPTSTDTATHTPHPRSTLKALGTRTPTPPPTRTKIVILPTDTPLPTHTPSPTRTPITYPAGNLLFNPRFEQVFSERDAPEVVVADGWQPWWQDGPGQAEGFYRRPEYQPEDIYRHGPRRIHDGAYAQKLFTTYATHNAGLMQQVNVMPGGRCTFCIWVQVWSSQYFDPESVTEPGNYRVWVGIDPYGGTDWRSPNIIWSPPHMEYNTWMLLCVSAIARRDVVTVFTRGEPEFRVKHNDSYWDDASLVETAP